MLCYESEGLIPVVDPTAYVPSAAELSGDRDSLRQGLNSRDYRDQARPGAGLLKDPAPLTAMAPGRSRLSGPGAARPCRKMRVGRRVQG